MHFLKLAICRFSRRVFRRTPQEMWLFFLDGIAESARVIAMVLILRPAADYLPARWSRSLAKRLSFIAHITAMDDGQNSPVVMKHAFNLSDRKAGELARKWLARQFCDFVCLRRIARGREDPEKWQIIQKNGVVLQQLQESRTPFILATGQFTRKAHIPLFTSAITSGQCVVAAQPRPCKAWHPRTMRLSVQSGQIRDCVEQLLRRDRTFIIGQAPISVLIEHLQHPGNIVYVTIDAYWFGKNGAYRRPFAGHSSFSFTMGPAVLAQVAKCPIVLCLPYIDASGAIVLEWGPVISPLANGDAKDAIRIMDELINCTERAIGLRPAQYVNAIGHGRHWNAATGQWEGPEADSDLAAPGRRSTVLKNVKAYA